MQRFLSILLYPFIFIGLFALKFVNKSATRYYGFIDKLFTLFGIYPMQNHYYNPFVIPGKDFKEVEYVKPREINPLNLNDKNQLQLISQFTFQEELREILNKKSSDKLVFSFSNDTFSYTDAEFYYSFIRFFKPKNIIEIGSGNSTKVAMAATKKNIDLGFTKCNVSCIEPFEMPWLEDLGIPIIRKGLQEVSLDFFSHLSENDILFIDSTHVIKPEGDVLFEYLKLLPSLKPGVLIHIHDIFTPYHYPLDWVKERRMWDEQYLLEAFLCYNDHFEVLCANNFLKNKYPTELSKASINFAFDKNLGTASFWIRKIK